MRQRDNTRAVARWENEGGTVVEEMACGLIVCDCYRDVFEGLYAGQTGATP
jgi:hypothetical protein